MPRLPLRPCPVPGCHALVDRGRCPAHQLQHSRQDARQRGSARQRQYTTEWDKLSKLYRAEHPLCERCEREGRLTETDMVHHLTPVSDGGGVFDADNLESLCWSCHARVHRELAARKRKC